ncbi:cation/H(+) antiporter 15-like [Canna indica]|uniref:Cation/H(+) antiporter 15-like n=1 Tax=Canna indica TaxID=4628 RepID=A0AAQ3JUN2_9LILI|nr:cation/H(+) antiporter 15-like [Canna indica]
MASTSILTNQTAIFNDFADVMQFGIRDGYCFHTYPTNSGGLWLGDDPLQFPLPNLLYQISFIFILHRLLHLLLRRFHQPIHVSQIVAGLLMGNCVLGQSFTFVKTVFAPQIHEQFTNTGMFSYMIFSFMAGLKADLNMVPKVGRKALAIAVVSTALPILSVYLLFISMKHRLPDAYSKTHLLLNVCNQWSLSSFIVLSCTLSELNLLSSKLGRLTLSATLISHVLHVFAEAFLVTFLLSAKMGSPVKGVLALLSFFGMLGLIVFVLRPIIVHLIRRTPEGKPLGEASLVAVMSTALTCGVVTQLAGFDLTTGPFFLGLVLPEGEPLGATLAHRMDTFVVTLFLPLTFCSSGMRVHFEYLPDVGGWQWIEVFLCVCIVTKFIGAVLPCLYCRMTQRDTITVGLMMLCKGVDEVVINLKQYTVIILTLLFISASTAPLIKYLYRPEERYVAYKNRSLEHSKPDDELRVLACIHEQYNVNPILALLRTSGPTTSSPICLYLLHLIQLVGRADSVILPHKYKSRTSSTDAPSNSDLIVNAFRRLFEQQYPDGYVSVLPFVCICPYTTMHDDICSLALDKKATLAILPFHKYFEANGTISNSNLAAKVVNVKVLRYAPCSVGILIDNGLSGAGSLLQRVAVYFFGGPDDREALAYAVRMADYTNIELTVVWFLPPEEWRQEGREEKIDDRMMKQFQHEKVDGRRVVCREELVRDGEETVAVIRKMSPDFNLLIVGRREGKESVLTAGLSTWSEYPELGIIGDLLASTDFGGGVSTLVVRQQVIMSASEVQASDVSPKSKRQGARGFLGSDHRVHATTDELP